MRVLETSSAKTFLEPLTQDLPDTIKAVLIVSPHWETKGLYYTAEPVLSTIHDFSGFPADLYQIQYPAANPLWLQDAVTQQLQSQGLSVQATDRGLDHGAWSVLSLMYPKVEMPTISVSLPMNVTLQTLYTLGQALAPLRNKGIMIVGTGMATHNLRRLQYQGETEAWAKTFTSWLQTHVAMHDMQTLFNYRHLAPNASTAHPRDEHLRPLFISLGAAAEEHAHLLHDSWELANANNSSWAWGIQKLQP